MFSLFVHWSLVRKMMQLHIKMKRRKCAAVSVFKEDIFWRNPFFLVLGAYIRASEVTSRCKTPQKHNSGIYLVPLCLKVPHLTSRSGFHFKSTSLLKLTPPPLLSPAHSLPPCWTDEASFWWKCSAVSCTEEHASSIQQQPQRISEPSG